MIRTIIIDDEVKSRETIREMLRIYCPTVEVVAHAQDVKSGIQAIRKYNPDLILLDIRMPDGSGFDLLKQLPSVDFKIIFITAYEEYAIKAFKFSAIDYVLKPIDPDELKSAIETAHAAIEKDNISDRLNTFFQHYDNDSSIQKKQIILRTMNSIYRIAIEDILYYESKKNYNIFHTISGEPIITSRTIKDYDEILLEGNFMRLHQSYTINLKYLRCYYKDTCEVEMINGVKIPVSFRRKDDLLRLLI
ncbi:MAG TPA: LytTR family DNA-binding domain-containing protein [Bacteroidales bacterium]